MEPKLPPCGRGVWGAGEEESPLSAQCLHADRAGDAPHRRRIIPGYVQCAGALPPRTAPVPPPEMATVHTSQNERAGWIRWESGKLTGNCSATL